MTAQKPTDSTQQGPSASPSGRKPWKKKTPVEVILDQINRLRDDVATKEKDLQQAKVLLQMLEETRKALEK
jgi:hypothetical protein